MAAITIENTKKNDVLSWWFDTGAFGCTLVYGRVVKVGAKKIKIRDEFGNEAWRYPQWFSDHKQNEQWIAELLADGVNIPPIP